ncbi:hypothetical protein CW304_25755 [Bacillus sp. UFRGS-B20]|nr:hypothetical protein CW304_25755 [Bacillus sp. UFRGS-B20]
MMGVGSPHPEGLAGMVKRKKGAIFGLAFEADGRPFNCVDEKGNIVTVDQNYFICAKLHETETGQLKTLIQLFSTVME